MYINQFLDVLEGNIIDSNLLVKIRIITTTLVYNVTDIAGCPSGAQLIAVYENFIVFGTKEGSNQIMEIDDDLHHTSRNLPGTHFN